MAGYAASEDSGYEKILKELGKFKMGAGCVYISKLEDVDVEKLKLLIRYTMDFMKKKYSC